MLKSSLRSRLAAITTPLVVAGLGIATSARHPGSASARVLVAVGALLWFIVVLDYPLRCRFTSVGLDRRCLARHHLLSWEDVAAIECAGSSVAALTVTGRRYLLARGARPAWERLQIPEGVVVRQPSERGRSRTRSAPL